eukprot:3018006-Pyramimonas_sp.AAC.1
MCRTHSSARADEPTRSPLDFASTSTPWATLSSDQEMSVTRYSDARRRNCSLRGAPHICIYSHGPVRRECLGARAFEYKRASVVAVWS